MAKKKTAGGVFDPSEENVYFIAAQVHTLSLAEQQHTHFLVAVNEINTPQDIATVDHWIDNLGIKVFIDSGIFWLTNEHKRAHGITMDEALSLAPGEIDGFESLRSKYIDLMRHFGDRCWGYIEMDQGGRENKIKTRGDLESMGLKPIPVYHPLNDGWDYFDELCQEYDRICFGNLVQASQSVRRSLVATAWERKQKYPDVWVHLLGYTPNQWLNAYPIDSADSSSWLTGIRWAASYKEKVMLQSFGTPPMGFRYDYDVEGHHPAGRDRAAEAAGYAAHMTHLNWRAHLEDMPL